MLQHRRYAASAEVSITTSTINFTFCASVELSFPFPSIIECQHYFASTCL